MKSINNLFLGTLPTVRQLRYLVALREAGHFGRAADACAVTQSTLSAGIQDLEALLGVTLADRSRRQVSLTPLGHELAERAAGILMDLDGLMAQAREPRPPLTGPLRMGIIPTIAPFFVPRIFPALQNAYPDLAPVLREDRTADLLEALDAGRLDVALLALPYALSGLTVEVLFDDPLLLCRPCGQEPDGPVPLSHVEDVDLIVLEDGHCLRDQVLSACSLERARGLSPIQATSLHTLVPMLAHGLGHTLMPRMALDAGILSGMAVEAVEFADAAPVRQVALVWAGRSSRDTEFKLLAQFLRDSWTAGRDGTAPNPYSAAAVTTGS